MLMELNTKWVEDIGLDVKQGCEFTGSAEKYFSALSRFYNNYEKNREKVQEFLESEDYENYTITVHALKSNSKMIGAMELGKAFEALENAGRENDIPTIQSITQKVLDDYAALIEKLKPISQMGEVKAADEISAQEAKETADKLLAALDDFEADEALELSQKLSGYPFRPTQKDKLKQAKNYISDFMYDEAADLVREIIPAIE